MGTRPVLMPAQLALTGFAAAPQPTEGVFLALYPDAAAAQRIAELTRRLRAELGIAATALQTSRLHATLHFLGTHAGVPSSLVTAARDAAARMVLAPFDLTFDRVGSFERRRGKCPLVLQGSDGVVALRAFQQTLGLALAGAGLARHVEGRYTPHVTLLYGEGRFDTQAVEPIGWTVREFMLVRSVLGRGVHVPLARWPLGPGAAPAGARR